MPKERSECPGQHDHTEKSGDLDRRHALDRQPGGQSDMQQPLGNALGEIGKGPSEVARARTGGKEPGWIVQCYFPL